MSNKLYVQNDGSLYVLVGDEAVGIFEQGWNELYRLEPNSEGLIEDIEDLDKLMRNGDPIGMELGNLTDIDTELLEEILFVKKNGMSPEQLGERLRMGGTVNPYESHDLTFANRNGCNWSMKYNVWFLFNSSFDDSEMMIYKRIMRYLE